MNHSWLDYPLGATAARHLGRALIRTSRVLARAGAALIGHPSARREKVARRPPLRVVPESMPENRRDYARGWMDARGSDSIERQAAMRRYTGYRDAR